MQYPRVQYPRARYHEDIDRKTYVEEPVVYRAAGTSQGKMPEWPEHISTVAREDDKKKEESE